THTLLVSFPRHCRRLEAPVCADLKALRKPPESVPITHGCIPLPARGAISLTLTLQKQILARGV
ncbi:unnamed protein product, partial [Discosporangium mesarthrocarpum]